MCIPFIYGCTNSNADNFNPEANTENDSCIISGISNEAADNYDETANNENGSCVISGCTDPIAYNFNFEATYDDGQYIYPETLDFNLVSLILNDTYGDGWNSNYLTISGSNYSIPDANGNYTTNNYDIYDGGFSQETFLCIDLSSCIDIIYNNLGHTKKKIRGALYMMESN